jgi:chitodextrinase
MKLRKMLRREWSALDNRWRTFRLLLLVIPIVSSARCARLATAVYTVDAAAVPSQGDWTDYGTILTNGALGEWDYQLFGGFTGTAVKKDGTYLLFYQGARGYRIVDDTVTWRAIGVATSPDGINFTKYGNNPVITWFPSNNGEEGAVSGSATLDDNGDVVLYYGANTEESDTRINADVRFATSPDGLSFTDRGIVLDHEDGSVWGSGDELFPIIAFRDAGRWTVYYIPNGTLQARKLGVAWGDGRDALTNSSQALSGGRSIQAWGMGGSAKVGPDTYALFLNDTTERRPEVRMVSPTAPSQLSAPVQTYQFDDVIQATVLLDSETNTWFMYYRSADEYGVMLAPAGEPDTSPPTAPASVTATPVSDRQVDLTWSPATDAQTGIVQYKVFRDGVHLGTVKGWHYTDTGLVERTEYRYTISAINYHGVQGPQSAAAPAVTPVDVTPPRVVSVNASGLANEVTMVFDEPLEKASAEIPGNYVIDQGVKVLGAKLGSDLRTVVLTTSEQTHSATYLLTLNGIRDRAQVANVMASNTAVRYTYSSVPGLVGAWTFDEGKGETAYDTGNHGTDGTLIYTREPGPAWTNGRFGHALRFDGVDDQVTIAGTGSLQDVTAESHTFSAWSFADRLPPNSTPNNASYSILVRDYTGLYYDYDGRFRARIRLGTGQEVSVSSKTFPPGSWHHLAMVVDDTNKALRLYVDGREVDGSPAGYSGSLVDHKRAPYYIGTSEPLTERYEYRFQGRIDEPLIFNRSLSQAEVRSLRTWSAQFLGFLPVLTKSR